MAGFGLCYLWLFLSNPKITQNAALPFVHKEAANEAGPLDNMPKPFFLSGVIQSINGSEMTAKLNVLGQDVLKKVKLPEGLSVATRQALSDQEQLGKYYPQFKAAQDKLKQNLNAKDAQAALELMDQLRFKAMQMRSETLAGLNDQLMALKPAQQAQRKALQDQLDKLMSGVTITSLQASALQAGQNIVVYLKNTDDADKPSITPAKLEVIK